MQTDELMQHLASAQMKLFNQRKRRALPVDTKVLTAWNALALSAFIQGARLLPEGQKYREAAKKVRDYLVTRLWDGESLHRALGKSGGIGKAGLEDYAYAARALSQWADLMNNKKDRQLAATWASTAWQKYYTATGWQRAESIGLPWQLGEPVLEDNPMPSPSAVLIQTSLELARQTNDKALRDRALSALGVGWELLRQQPFAYPTQIRLIAQVR
jgi:uncharacterized protein YyaL (SSP411 family)